MVRYLAERGADIHAGGRLYTAMLAEIDIYTATYFGVLNVVEAFLDAEPELINQPSPHHAVDYQTGEMPKFPPRSPASPTLSRLCLITGRM